MIVLGEGGGRNSVVRGFAAGRPSPFDFLGIALLVLFPPV